MEFAQAAVERGALVDEGRRFRPALSAICRKEPVVRLFQPPELRRLRLIGRAQHAVDANRLGLADDGDAIELEGSEIRCQPARRFAEDYSYAVVFAQGFHA